MTQDDILRMVREAELVAEDGSCAYISGTVLTPFLERFAALVAASEREACAKECDKTYHQHIGDGFGGVRYGIAACAAAIRARSTQ